MHASKKICMYAQVGDLAQRVFFSGREDVAHNALDTVFQLTGPSQGEDGEPWRIMASMALMHQCMAHRYLDDSNEYASSLYSFLLKHCNDCEDFFGEDGVQFMRKFVQYYTENPSDRRQAQEERLKRHKLAARGRYGTGYHSA